MGVLQKIQWTRGSQKRQFMKSMSIISLALFYPPWSSSPSFEIFLHVQKEPETSNKQASPGGKCYHLSVCAFHVHCVGWDLRLTLLCNFPVKFSGTLIHTNNSIALSGSAVLSLSNWPIFNRANGFWMSDVAVANWPTSDLSSSNAFGLDADPNMIAKAQQQ